MAAALLAGVPQVPCPVMLDQPHNARVLVSLGVAPAVVPYTKSLSAAKLASAISLTLTSGAPNSFREASEKWSRFVKDESSVSLQRFAEIIEGAPIVKSK